MKILLAITLSLLSTFAFAQPPALGADCGAGATISGSIHAGKVTLGTGVDQSDTCTLTWAAQPKAPSCAAGVEAVSDGTGNAGPRTTTTTTTTLVIAFDDKGHGYFEPGYVVSYLCVAP